jgi:hypothetical protein
MTFRRELVTGIPKFIGQTLADFASGNMYAKISETGHCIGSAIGTRYVTEPMTGDEIVQGQCIAERRFDCGARGLFGPEIDVIVRE